MNPPNGQQLEQVKQAIFAGRKIEAIKIHRDATASGLKESKEAVEQLEAELRKTEAHRFAKSAAKSGCFSMLAVCAGFVMLTLLAGLCWARLPD